MVILSISIAGLILLIIWLIVISNTDGYEIIYDENGEPIYRSKQSFVNDKGYSIMFHNETMSHMSNDEAKHRKYELAHDMNYIPLTNREKKYYKRFYEE